MQGDDNEKQYHDESENALAKGHYQALKFTYWPFHDRETWEEWSPAAAVDQFGEVSIAAAETILLQNPSLTLALYDRTGELLIEWAWHWVAKPVR